MCVSSFVFSACFASSSLPFSIPLSVFPPLSTVRPSIPLPFSAVNPDPGGGRDKSDERILQTKGQRCREERKQVNDTWLPIQRCRSKDKDGGWPQQMANTHICCFNCKNPYDGKSKFTKMIWRKTECSDVRCILLLQFPQP